MPADLPDVVWLLYADVSEAGCCSEIVDTVGCGINVVSRNRVPTLFLTPPTGNKQHMPPWCLCFSFIGGNSSTQLDDLQSALGRLCPLTSRCKTSVHTNSLIPLFKASRYKTTKFQSPKTKCPLLSRSRTVESSKI